VPHIGLVLALGKKDIYIVYPLFVECLRADARQRACLASASGLALGKPGGTQHTLGFLYW